jgi:high affinity Mn2+ porin
VEPPVGPTAAQGTRSAAVHERYWRCSKDRIYRNHLHHLAQQRRRRCSYSPTNVRSVRRYTSRGGISLNVEQQLLLDLGFFARAGLATDNVEPYEFTDVDRTIAAGFSLSGTRWERPNDTLGVAGAINGISSVHQAFLNAGGLGILVGDGKLPHPGAEYIFEAYYIVRIRTGVFAAFDVQYIKNPAYNRDRGPVWVPGFRFHVEF